MAKGIAGNKIRTFACLGCRDVVTRRARPGQTYCSLPCYRSGQRPKRLTGETRACAICGAEFYVPGGRVKLNEGRFCSTACHNLHQGRSKTEHCCIVCGAIFRWSPSRTASGKYNIKYCSLPCRNQDPEYIAGLIARQAQLLRGRTTRAEAIGYALLDEIGVTYEPQATFKRKFTPDATIADALLIVQFDGDYWHDRKGVSTEPRIRRRVALDKSQDAYIKACGWQVLRLWETDLMKSPDVCAEEIRQHLRLPS